MLYDPNVSTKKFENLQERGTHACTCRWRWRKKDIAMRKMEWKTSWLPRKTGFGTRREFHGRVATRGEHPPGVSVKREKPSRRDASTRRFSRSDGYWGQGDGSGSIGHPDHHPARRHEIQKRTTEAGDPQEWGRRARESQFIAEKTSPGMASPSPQKHARAAGFRATLPKLAPVSSPLLLLSCPPLELLPVWCVDPPAKPTGCDRSEATSVMWWHGLGGGRPLPARRHTLKKPCVGRCIDMRKPLLSVHFSR